MPANGGFAKRNAQDSMADQLNLFQSNERKPIQEFFMDKKENNVFLDKFDQFVPGRQKLSVS